MGCLADTHLALWLIAGSDKLPRAAKERMADPQETWYLSIVSAWEVMLKHRSHPEQMLIDAGTFLRDCEAAGFRLMPLKPEHITTAATLPLNAKHKDPFDQMLLAQALNEGLLLVTHDHAFKHYDSSSIMLV